MPMSEYMRELRGKLGHRLLEVPAVSVVTRDDEGRVLLVQHENGLVWVTPGGAVEPNEVPADSAVREMWEETGLEVELVRIVGVYGGPEFVVNYANGDRTSYLMVIFEGRRIGGELRPDGVEALDAGYFSREQVRSIDTPVWLDQILSDVFENPTETTFRSPSWTPPAAT
jgi:ADP-ribose pyrophosphatase YjhB (NUDIX family)